MTSLQAVDLKAFRGVLALVEGSAPATRGTPAPGEGRTPGGWLAPDVSSWIASPEQGLTAAIESVSGVTAVIRALAGLAPSSLTVVASVHSDRASWAEITRRRGAGPETCLAGAGPETRRRGAGPETCLAGLTYDPGGRVSRLVWLRASLVPLPRPGTTEDAPDARPVLESYFAALMNSRFREAAAHFTADTLYSHPPYAAGSQRVLFRGRDALACGFETERGPSPARQIITGLWQRGSRSFVEGIIEGIPNGGSFFSTAEISREGEIARYVAFYSATRIPRAR